MKKIFALATMLLAVTSFAAGTAKDAKKTDKKEAAVTKADVAAGTITWTGYGVGKSHTGTLTIKSGSVDLKGEEVVGGNFIIDMKSLKTADSEKLQGHLRSADFFDVEKYPEATFKITKVEAIKGAKAPAATHKVYGDLTIKGKTHAEEMAATVTKQGAKYEAKGSAEIKDRTQYDIVYNSGKFKAVSALGDKLIEDKIKIELNVTTK